MNSLFELDFTSREYIAEVLTTRSASATMLASRALKIAESERKPLLESGEEDRATEDEYVQIRAGLVAFNHRLGSQERIPRKTKQGKYLYDVIVASRGQLAIVALPYDAVARDFFPRLDRALAGTRTRYEKLNINELVIQLGSRGKLRVKVGTKTATASNAEIRVTRCSLAYEDPGTRDRVITSLGMAGQDLGRAPEYQMLVEPVVNAASSTGRRVTPSLLGVSLVVDGVRKASIETDRHGNFRFWISPSLRGIQKCFLLLEALQSMKGIVTTSSSVPILQVSTSGAGTVR